MARRVVLTLALAGAVAAQAETYRCDEPDGSVRFTSDPRRCERPIVHEPQRDRFAVPPAEPAPAARAPLGAADLAALFPPPHPGWQVIGELPETSTDPELRALGLRDSTARHYTRARGDVSEVCTIELWAFAQPDQAVGAGAALAQPTWWARAAGSLLVLAHGVRLERQVGSRTELVAGCEAIALATHARALATLPGGGRAP